MRTAMTVATVLVVGTAVVGGIGPSLVVLAAAPVIGVVLGLLSVGFKWK